MKRKIVVSELVTRTPTPPPPPLPVASPLDTEMSFLSHANETHFHKNSFELSLVLKVRVIGTRKWPFFKAIST